MQYALICSDLQLILAPMPHNQPPLIEQETEFAPDNPTVIRETFAADLLGAAALAHGVDQLDAVGVNDAEHGRGGQEGLRPVLMDAL